MSHITRQDGTQFVMQAYREHIPLTKKSIVLQEIRLIAEQQGQFVRIFRRGRKHIEAVFAQTPGYLLGETVGQYFQQPQDFIFCEAIEGSNDVILVVIREGSVYLDKRLSNSELRSELLPLMAESQSCYHIVTSGEVALAATDSPTTFAFPSERVASFDKLPLSLLSRLRPVQSLQLQPLPLALRSAKLSQTATWVSALAMVVLVGLSGWWILTPKQTGPRLLVHPAAKKVANPYAAYERALKTPAPYDQLIELERYIEALYFIPGWRVTNVQMMPKRYVISLADDGGNLAMLSQWAKEHGLEYKVTAAGPKLIAVSDLRNRPIPQHRQDLQEVATELVDEMDVLLHEKGVTIGETRQIGKMRALDITLTIHDAAPELLNIMAREFRGRPLVITQAEVSVQHGLLNGSIQLSIWGS